MALNPQQQEAVEHVEGSLLILAGAGSGKTTVLVKRIAHMAGEKGVSPDSILAVTFTNKAANEMKRRVESEIGAKRAEEMWILTFHAMCTRILREDWSPEFSIISTTGARQTLKEAIEELGVRADEDPEFFKPSQLMKVISLMKNEMISREVIETGRGPRGYVDAAKVKTIIGEEIGGHNFKRFRQIFSRYEEKLSRKGLIDVDDILLKTAYLFLERPDILEKYQDRFRYVMVDEYQDTNHVQYVLAKLLAQKSGNLAVVGDDKQTIYRFRGAEMRNILEFENEYPEAKIVKLERNYRSSQNILDVANQIISRNKGQKEKTLYTENGEGEKIRLFEGIYAADEAEIVASEIRKLVASGKYAYRDIAVFYRNNSDSSAFEAAFPKAGIPFVVSSDGGFFEQEEIRDILAYIRFVANQWDAHAFERAVNQPKRGVGKTTIEKLVGMGKGTDLLSLCKNPEGVERLNAKTKEGLESFAGVIEDCKKIAEKKGLAALVSAIIEKTGYKSLFDGMEAFARRDKEARLEKLAQIAAEMESKQGGMAISAFLDSLKKTDVDAEIREEDSFDRVALSTIHSAKGLEFPVVFMVCMREGLFPSQYSLHPEAIEEERRLCHVAVTRAKELLHMSLALKYFEKNASGEREERESRKSRFLDEFDSKLATREW